MLQNQPQPFHLPFMLGAALHNIDARGLYAGVAQQVGQLRQMGKQQEHIKLFGRFADAVGFQLAEAYQSLGCPSTVDLLGSIGENTFRGVTSLQFQFHAIQASQEPLLP